MFEECVGDGLIVDVETRQVEDARFGDGGGAMVDGEIKIHAAVGGVFLGVRNEALVHILIHIANGQQAGDGMVEVAGKDDIVCLYRLPVAEGNGDGFVVNDVHPLGFPSCLQHAAQGLVSADHALYHASAAIGRQVGIAIGEDTEDEKEGRHIVMNGEIRLQEFADERVPELLGILGNAHLGVCAVGFSDMPHGVDELGFLPKRVLLKGFVGDDDRVAINADEADELLYAWCVLRG